MTVKNTLFSSAIEEIAKQNINWATDANIKCALLHVDNNEGDPWDQTRTLWADVSDWEVTEVASTGYTAGGQSMPAESNSIFLNGRVTEFKSTHNPIWTDSTIDATHAVVYVDGETKYLLAMVDFGGEESSSSGAFEVTWTGEVVFQITVAEKS